MVVVAMRQLVYDARDQIRAIKKYGACDNGTGAKRKRKAEPGNRQDPRR
jgi:hypothetical protein